VAGLRFLVLDLNSLASAPLRRPDGRAPHLVIV
jgi:hypothetical protein